MKVSPGDKAHLLPTDMIKTASGKTLTVGEIAAMEVVDVLPKYRQGAYTGYSVGRAIAISCAAGLAAAGLWSIYELGRLRQINDWYQEYDRLRATGYYDECGGKKQS